MPVYEYKALDAGGKDVAGIVVAKSPAETRLRIRVEGFILFAVFQPIFEMNQMAR